MTTPVSAERRDGLRERKKAKTRRTIQEQALRLFAEQGYDATTVEQIAEAAEVSPSTFFRYFPTKEAVVLQDDYDALLQAALAAQPPDAPLGTVLRDTFRAAFARIPEEEQEEILARRYGRDPSDLMIRTLCGAITGALVPTLLAWVEQDGRRPLSEMVDEALAHLSDSFKD